MSSTWHPYSFRNRELTAHTRIAPTGNPLPASICTVDEGWEILLPGPPTRLGRYYASDLCRFFAEALGLSLRVRYLEGERPVAAPHTILLLPADDPLAPRLASEMAGAFYLSVKEDSITVVGKTERGTAQGVYYLEDAMRLLGLPCLGLEESEHAPLFSPRMTHSGTELDTFPDDYLAAVAHAGMDAIIVYAGHPDSHLHGFPDPDALWPGTGRGCCDFANLVWRAAGYGLDVYVYSQMICDRAPDAPDAHEYYDASFGRLFREAPGLRGLILVGESFEFPSRDPHTTGGRVQLKQKGDTRPSSGRYPSCDYPEMLSLVRDVVRAYTPDADIVFWSYNFGWTPAEARLSLIRTLPRDISYLVTFEVWERLSDEEGRRYSVADYSITYPGPCRIFREEAACAHECGLRLYTMGNTGGRTWDTGGCPYIPTPALWQERYAAIRRAKEEYGLSGLMENHHYGWLPSFLTLFAKNAFLTNGRPDAEMLAAIARRDFGGECGRAMEAWSFFDAGMRRLIPSVTDQYGPFRAGPTYPLLFFRTAKDLHPPRCPWAWHPAGGIWKLEYPDGVFGDVDNSLLRLSRVSETVASLERGVQTLAEGVAALGAPAGSEPSRQLAVARFLLATYVTAMHVMRWNVARRLLFALEAGESPARAEELYAALGITEPGKAALGAEMLGLLAAEEENVALGLMAYREDSSIGYEASMEYVFDEENAAWKLSELKLARAELSAYLNEKEG